MSNGSVVDLDVGNGTSAGDPVNPTYYADYADRDDTDGSENFMRVGDGVNVAMAYDGTSIFVPAASQIGTSSLTTDHVPVVNVTNFSGSVECLYTLSDSLLEDVDYVYMGSSYNSEVTNSTTISKTPSTLIYDASTGTSFSVSNYNQAFVDFDYGTFYIDGIYQDPTVGWDIGKDDENIKNTLGTAVYIDNTLQTSVTFNDNDRVRLVSVGDEIVFLIVESETGDYSLSYID